jgi:sugar O-acyltransferase (sialic acid O-acetyltransferase NeuD family)
MLTNALLASISLPLSLIGAGGHAKVVYDALRQSGFTGKVQVRDDDGTLQGKPFLDLCIETPILNRDESVRSFHVAIGNNPVRAKLSAILQDKLRVLLTIQHPKATFALGACHGVGCFFAAGAIVGPEADIGNGCIINHGAVVDHDCRVGEYSHVAPNATLGGGARIGRYCLIGAGAVVLPGRVIGDGAIVGAGAVVVRDLPAGGVWTGVPAIKRG